MESFLLAESRVNFRECNIDVVFELGLFVLFCFVFQNLELGLDKSIGIVHTRLFRRREQHGPSDKM